MAAASTTPLAGPPRGRPLTRAGLDRMPDDGHRYELIDGVLIVSPAPRITHQDVVAALYLLLRAACTADLKVLFAPVEVALTDDTVMQPDLLVARRVDFTERDLPPAPRPGTRPSRSLSRSRSTSARQISSRRPT